MPISSQIYFLPFYFLSIPQLPLPTGLLPGSANGRKSGRWQQRSEKRGSVSLSPAALTMSSGQLVSNMVQLLPNSLVPAFW